MLSSSATSFQALSLLSMYLYWSSSVSYSTWCCLILLIITRSMLVSLAMAIAAAITDAVDVGGDDAVVVPTVDGTAATSGDVVTVAVVVSAGSATTLLRRLLGFCDGWWLRRLLGCALGVLAGDGMDDNWWPWRRPRRDEGLPPPPPPSRRHGAFGSTAAARERGRGRGSGGVSVGRPPCCCGACVPLPCRRRAVASSACVRESPRQRQTRRLPLDTAAGRVARLYSSTLCTCINPCKYVRAIARRFYNIM